MRRKLILGGIALVFLTLIGVGIAKFYEGGSEYWKQIATTPAKRGDFTVKIEEVGIFKAVKENPVKVPRLWGWGRTITKMAEEETSVKKGDPVAWIDTKDVENRLREQESRLKQSKADLDKNLENLKLTQEKNKLSVEEAEANLGFARTEQAHGQREYVRTEELVEAKLLPREDLKEAEVRKQKADLKVKEMEYRLASARQADKSGEKINKTDIEDARARYQRSEKRVERYEKDIEKSVIKAPVDGIVIHATRWDWAKQQRVKVREGDRIWRGVQLMSIPDLSEMLVKTQVPETEIDRVQVGQKIHIKADAYPDLKLTGKITDIMQLAVHRIEAEGAGFVEKNARESKVFEVTVSVDQSDPRLRPGATAEVEIVIKTIPDAVYVPFEAVFERNQKTYVYVANDSDWEEREVKVGEKSGDQVTIEEGVEEEEQVMLTSPLLVAAR